MPHYDDPTILYDSPTTYDGGTVVPTFTPQGDDIVPPIYLVYDPYYPVIPQMQRLFGHYANRPRGRNIFLMSDGTFRDSQVQGTPPNMNPDHPKDPYATWYVNDANGNAQRQGAFQVPTVIRTYYGGSANQVTPAEVAALEAAGYTV